MATTQSNATATVKCEVGATSNQQSTHVEIDLIDVRASDGIRVSYDFDRDGWRIEQPTVFEWEVNDKVCDQGWTEVAFVNSWTFDNEDI